jgi:hypothetical protein
MQVEWYGQSAFRLTDGKKTVFIDPFDVAFFAGRRRWDYPAIAGVDAQLLLVTHEHGDHNAVHVIGGNTVTLRSTAGTHTSPIGDVIGIASEHDEVAGHSAAPTRSSPSPFAVAASPTSATSARAPYAPSSSQRSAPSTCSSSPSAAAPPPAPSRQPRSPPSSARRS